MLAPDAPESKDLGIVALTTLMFGAGPADL